MLHELPFAAALHRRSRDHARQIGLLALPLLLATGCARIVIADAELERLREGSVDAGRVVFICHGILKDLGMPWDFAMRDELRAAGFVPILMTYFAEPTGTWFNWGSTSPARKLAQLADDLTRLSETCDGQTPLALCGIGFSNGCEVLLDAAALARVAHFDRLVFLGSSSFAWSPLPGELIASGRIGEIHDHWSPLDLVTLFAPLGAGSFGLRTGSDHVRHHAHWRYHLPPLLRSDRRHLMDDLTPATGSLGAIDTQLGVAFARLLEQRRDRAD